MPRRAALLLPAILLALAASGCGEDGDGESDETTTATQTETATTGAAAGCQDVEAPDPREDGGETQPDAARASRTAGSRRTARRGTSGG